MHEPTSRLPERPSLEQLRKQAKELLKQHRAGEVAATERLRPATPRLAEQDGAAEITLADAHLAIAREHGFESWPKLVHHIEGLRPASLDQHERLARDLVVAYGTGDADAIRRLNDLFHSSYDLGQIRDFVQQRLETLPDAERRSADFVEADARLLVANLYGFESWARLVEASAQPPQNPRVARDGLSATPPFYRIDWTSGTIEPKQPMSARDWDTLFGVMKELRLSGLNANGHMSDDVMERLQELDHVTRLNLGGSKRLTDKGVRHLADMPHLEELELSGRITDHGLEVLRQLPELRTFQMYWHDGITDAGVANLAFCDRLERVDLLGTTTGDGAIKALTGKRSLRRFKSGRLVTDAGLRLLHQFPVFKTWQGGDIGYGLMSPDAEPNHLLLDGPFTDRGLAELAGLEGLFGLSFFWHVGPGLTANGLEVLRALPRLGVLGCEGRLCDDQGMRHIAAIPRLRMLMAQGTVAGDDGFAALASSPTIEYIWGRECPNLTGRGFAALAAMPKLRGLAVSCKYVDDAALATLPSFPALDHLMPMDIPDEGFRHVGRCTRLEELTCMYCRDTGDVATGHIAGLSRLAKYYAGKTQITDRSLEILGRMTSLEDVSLSACARITNAGLAYLAGLPRLRAVSFDATAHVTRAAIAFFPPHVRVGFWI